MNNKKFIILIVAISALFLVINYIVQQNNFPEPNYNNGSLTFSNFEIELPTGVSIPDLFNDTTGTTSFSQDAIDFVTPIQSIDDASTGANLSVFSWTYTAQNSGRF